MESQRNDTAPGGGAQARAWIGALSLVVIGAVLGIAIDRHVLLGVEGAGGAAAALHGAPGGPASAAAELHDALMTSLAERLDLDADQRRQIDSIMAARHDLLHDTWRALHVQLGAAVDTVHHEIEAVLTPAQRDAFRDWARAMAPDR